MVWGNDLLILLDLPLLNSGNNLCCIFGRSRFLFARHSSGCVTRRSGAERRSCPGLVHVVVTEL